MNLRLISAAAVLAAGLAAAPAFPAAGPPAAEAAPMPSLAPMVKRVSPAVVNIATRGTIKEKPGQRNPLLDDPFFRQFFNVPPDSKPRERAFQSAGSGVIVDARNGYIITNYHVIENANEITVTLLDNRSFSAKVIGSDEGADIAVLQAKQPNLVAMALGDSSRLEVGDYVVAIGNPFGLQHTVTAGIISAKNRSIGAGPYDDFLQTDAAINFGNSGGPLFDLKGTVIGINTAINAQGQNLGFAIPIDEARAHLDELKNFGHVVRPWLGMLGAPITPAIQYYYQLPVDRGLVISKLSSHGPAAKAGISPGDVLMKLNGQEITGNGDAQRILTKVKPGETVSLKVNREGRVLNLDVTVTTAPDTSDLPEGVF